MKTVEEKALNEIEKQQKEAGIAFLGVIQLEVPEFNAVKNALEKQIPKHYEVWNNQCSCPTCNKLFGSYDQLKTLIHWEMPYCKFCGQALDWSDHPTEKGGGNNE